MVGTKTGQQLLILGTAECIWSDLAEVEPKEFELMAINDLMMHWPWGKRLDYGITLHPEKLPGWGFFQSYQAKNNGWKPMEVHSNRGDRPGVTHAWPIHRSGGNSGLFGVLVGLLMGYDRIVLAGVPCTDTPRYFDPPWRRHTQFGKDMVLREWERAQIVFQDKVKSLSGRTRVLLGAP